MWVIEIIFDLLVEALLGLHTGVARAADLDHRNDRGKLKRPSKNYVC